MRAGTPTVPGRSTAVGVPVAPAVAAAAHGDAARDTGGKTKQQNRKNEATHGYPFCRWENRPSSFVLAGASPRFKSGQVLHWTSPYRCRRDLNGRRSAAG